jgi:DNA-binding NarL/FixJ family response regulator
MRAVRDCPPHVAIVDISLSESSGLELIKEIKQAHPEIRVLVLTMHEESHYAARALRAGAAAYLVKREATGKVIPAIRAVLAGKLVLSQLPVETQPEANSASAHSPMEVLSDREFEVFELLGKGLGTRQIAAALRLSIKTVQTHCSAVKEKLHLGTGRELLREAVRWHECRQPQ